MPPPAPPLRAPPRAAPPRRSTTAQDALTALAGNASLSGVPSWPLNGSFSSSDLCSTTVDVAAGSNPRITIQRNGDGAATPAGVQLTLRLFGLRAPLYTQNVSGLVSLTTATLGVSGALGSAIDISGESPSFPIVPGPLSITYASLSTFDAGKISDLRLAVELPAELVAGAKLTLTLPAEVRQT